MTEHYGFVSIVIVRRGTLAGMVLGMDPAMVKTERFIKVAAVTVVKVLGKTVEVVERHVAKTITILNTA